MQCVKDANIRTIAMGAALVHRLLPSYGVYTKNVFHQPPLINLKLVFVYLGYKIVYATRVQSQLFISQVVDTPIFTLKILYRVLFLNELFHLSIYPYFIMDYFLDLFPQVLDFFCLFIKIDFIYVLHNILVLPILAQGA